MASLSVRRLKLVRFRSYLLLDIGLDARPVVVLGPNGAGKTNLLEAVSLLSPGRGLRRALADELPASGAEIWRVAAEVRGRGVNHEIITKSEGAGRLVEIDGKTAPQVMLSDVARVLWLTPAMDRLWMEAPSERRRFLDRITMSLIPSHAEASLGYERALRERNRLLRDGVRDAAWHGALEGQMAEHGARVLGNRRQALARLAEAQRPGPFPTADLALQSEAPESPEELANALAAGRGRDLAAGRSLLGPHRDDLLAIFAPKGVPARSCSTGEQKALLLSLTLASARAVGEDFGAMPLLLLDEVAAHLDAGRRAAFFEALGDLGVQAWMTGAGADLFADLGDQAQWLEVREGAATRGAGASAEEPQAGSTVMKGDWSRSRKGSGQ